MTTNPATETAAEDVSARIARVAAQLFAEQGYDATSVRTIVESAAVTKPALYYYFQSKEGLAHYLLTEPMTRLVGSMQSILAGTSAGVEKLEQLIEAQFAFCRENPDRARFVYALFFGPLGRSLSTELTQYASTMRVIVDEAVLRLAEEGVIEAEQTDACATCVRGLVTAYTMDFLYREAPLDSELPARCVSDVLQGFARPVGRGRRRPLAQPETPSTSLE
ncbi:MAG: TetR/AcrR family transcriptional regulator [Planctomycetaceae bacterium]|nr:TetR/AcrR family transcriptional regulator [Planctomycetaceae bacterium]